MNWNDYLQYCDGKLFWKQPVSAKSRVQVGDEAGSFIPSIGRYMVCVAGKRAMRSRVIWEMHNGPIAAGMEVDHADQNKTNDSITNLRLASRTENNVNRKVKLPANGYRGVEQTGNRWRAKLARKPLGTFETPEIAALAYNAAAFAEWGEFAQLNEVVL